MVSQLVKSIYELEYLCKKADVQDMPRVSIVFSNLRDKAMFTEEVVREISAQNMYLIRQPYQNTYEFTINNIKIRIL